MRSTRMTVAALALLAVNWHVAMEVRWPGVAALAVLILISLVVLNRTNR